MHLGFSIVSKETLTFGLEELDNQPTTATGLGFIGYFIYPHQWDTLSKKDILLLTT